MAKTQGQLALGGAWAVKQGVQDVRAAALFALELGFGGLVPAPSGRLFPWDAFPGAVEDLPVEVPAIRVDSPVEGADGSLASSRADEVLVVRSRVARAAQLGARIGCSTLVLEVPTVRLDGEHAQAFEVALAEGRDPKPELFGFARSQLAAMRDSLLERSCRNLHALLREFPDFRIALTESAQLGSMSAAADLEAMLEDLSGVGRLAYWHRPAVAAWRAASGGIELGTRLEILDKYLAGMDLDDFGELGPRAVAGSGLVDYSLLAPYFRSSSRVLPLCFEPDHAVRSGEVRQGRAFLGKFGL